MSKIILLSERLPYPPTSGTKNLLYNYCKILHESLGMDVVNISFLEKDEDNSKKPDFIERIYELPNPSGFVKLKNIVFKTFVRNQYPLQVSLFWDAGIKNKIEEIIVKEQPDYVISDFIRTTEYLKDYKGFKIADLQDLLSLRYERQLKVDLNTINPYGAYLFRLPKIFQKILQLSLVKQYVMKMEIRLLKKFEINVGKCYDRIMFVARSEAEKFDQMIGEKKTLITPLGVDYDFFSQDLDLQKKEHSIAFMGALNVAHNENGIVHFIEKCMPTILEYAPETRLYIIGGGASEKLKNYASDHIVFTGKVPDVRVAVGECEVFICPLQFGSGIKTKILESMAMGVPVVTTPIGAENIGAFNGKDWLVGNTDQDFVNQIIRLLSSRDLRIRIGKNGQRFVKENFTWEVARNAFAEVFANEQTNKNIN